MTAAAILFVLEVAVILWASGYMSREKARKREQAQRHQLSRWHGNEASLALYEARREVGGASLRAPGAILRLQRVADHQPGRRRG